jgi:hypothetical protein
MSERGEHFLKSLAGSRAAVVGHPVPVADMGRVMFLEDVFLDSETDIAFLNSFGMRAAFDGVPELLRPSIARRRWIRWRRWWIDRRCLQAVQLLSVQLSGDVAA